MTSKLEDLVPLAKNFIKNKSLARDDQGRAHV
jgi:hypothetical protein